MKIILTQLLLFAFVMQLGLRVYVIAKFELNKAYIVENLCEQKDEEENCCMGSCHLTKELAKVEEKADPSDSKNNEPKVEKTEDFPSCLNAFNAGLITKETDLKYISKNSYHFPKGFLKFPDQPPRFFYSL
ncbi:MAG: hypothetical protein IPM51_07895 [Sphingobacteriaceae bacterium]|nr:hypothetical protein [Sphingobacteriaceae bacterium]